MKTLEVTIVRIYLHEAGSNMEDLLEYLHDKSKVRGVTVFRGVTGFGRSGKFHSSSLIDMSLDLPLVIEFFEDREKVAGIIEYLDTIIKPGHMVFWDAKIHE